MAQVLSKGLPFLKNFVKAAPILSQLYGGYEGTRRWIQGQDPHQIALGYGYALPGPWGWGNFAADMVEQGLNPKNKTSNEEFKLPGEFPGTKEEFDAKYGTGETFKLPGEFPGTKEEFDKKYGTGKDDYTVGQKVTAFLNNQSPETRYGVDNYGGDRIPLAEIIRAQDYDRRRNRFELTPEEQKTTIMSPLEQEMYW